MQLRLALENGSRKVIIQGSVQEIMRKTPLLISIVVLLISCIVVGQSHEPVRKFDNQYMTITILPGWQPSHLGIRS
jgi:hypothetical protein